jgi:hypothetical protein
MQGTRLRMSFQCDQNPSSFKNGETGFCARCQKQVHDFSDLPAAVIQNRMRQEGGSVCGRIFADQLNEQTRDRSFSFRLNLFAGACMALLMLAVNRGQAQMRDSVKTEQHPASQVKGVQKDQAPLATADTLDTNSAPLTPAEKKKIRERKFMHIGKYDYFILARFPFISIRRQRFRVMDCISF